MPDFSSTRRASHESVDMPQLLRALHKEEESRQAADYNNNNNSAVDGKNSVSARMAAAAAAALARQQSDLSNFSQHIENERYKGVREIL